MPLPAGCDMERFGGDGWSRSAPAQSGKVRNPGTPMAEAGVAVSSQPGYVVRPCLKISTMTILKSQPEWLATHLELLNISQFYIHPRRKILCLPVCPVAGSVRKRHPSSLAHL